MTREAVRRMGAAKRLALGALALGAIAVPVMVGLTAPAPPASAAAPAANPVGKITLLPGNRVKLNYQNVDVRDLIRAMADAGRVNILVSDQVTGTITVELTETTWDHALDVILGSMSLTRHEKDGILFIEPAAA